MQVLEEYWSGKRDLNPRPSPWQGDALPLSYSRSITVDQRGGILLMRGGSCQAISQAPLIIVVSLRSLQWFNNATKR